MHYFISNILIMYCNPHLIMLFFKPFFITIRTLKLILNLQTRVVRVRAKSICVYNLLRLY